MGSTITIYWFYSLSLVLQYVLEWALALQLLTFSHNLLYWKGKKNVYHRCLKRNQDVSVEVLEALKL